MALRSRLEDIRVALATRSQHLMAALRLPPSVAAVLREPMLAGEKTEVEVARRKLFALLARQGERSEEEKSQLYTPEVQTGSLLTDTQMQALLAKISQGVEARVLERQRSFESATKRLNSAPDVDQLKAEAKEYAKKYQEGVRRAQEK